MAETTEIHVPESMHIEQTGPETPVGEQADGTYKETPRDKFMRELVEKSNARLARELAYGEELAREAAGSAEDGEEPSQTGTVEDQEQSGATGADSQAAQASPNGNLPDAANAKVPGANEPSPAPQQLPSKRKFTVNGRDLELTEDEITRAVQLGLSSQERFQHAARLRQEAEALRTQTLVTPQVTAVPQAQPTPQAASTQPMLDDQRAREFARKLAYGSEDDQAKAIRDLGDVFMQAAIGRQAQAPNPMLIANTAAELAEARVTHKSNVERIGSEYQDIFQDNDLSQLAGMKVYQLADKYRALQQPVTQYQLMKEACDEVRTKYLKPVQTQQIQPTPEPAVTPKVDPDKITRKRTAPQQPAAANAKARMPQAPQTPSGSQIVAQMRKARGQQLYN